MASKKTTSPFADMRCIHCGEAGGLAVKVDDLTLMCECGEETTRAEVEAIVHAWTRLFAWIDSAKS
jgi:hypothetical protein